MLRTFFCIVFCFSPILANAADPGAIGRLFHSPEERRVLDQLRRGDGRNSEIPDRASAAQQITLDGVVKRNSGKFTAWINQVPQHENETLQDIQVLHKLGGRSAASLLLSTGKRVNLKAGQTYDIVSGTVEDVIKP